MIDECTPKKKGEVLSEAAFRELFYKYRKSLILDAYRILGDVHEAEDVVQETFIKLWERNYLQDVEPGAFRAYLHNAVKNNCLSRKSALESSARRKNQYIDTMAGDDVTEQAESWELRERIHRAILELPPQRRIAFVNTYMDNKSYRETGQEMGLSIETVKSHVKIALKNLRNSLSGLHQ